MAIVDKLRIGNDDRPIVVHTTYGDFFINRNFQYEKELEMLKLTDCTNGDVYFVNPDYIVWIGPR